MANPDLSNPELSRLYGALAAAVAGAPVEGHGHLTFMAACESAGDD
jgi:hypothetical protein